MIFKEILVRYGELSTKGRNKKILSAVYVIMSVIHSMILHH